MGNLSHSIFQPWETLGFEVCFVFSVVNWGQLSKGETLDVISWQPEMIVETNPQWKKTVHFDGKVLWTLAVKQTDADFGGFFLCAVQFSSIQRNPLTHWDAMYMLVVLDLDTCCMLHHATCSYTMFSVQMFFHMKEIFRVAEYKRFLPQNMDSAFCYHFHLQRYFLQKDIQVN